MKLFEAYATLLVAWYCVQAVLIVMTKRPEERNLAAAAAAFVVSLISVGHLFTVIKPGGVFTLVAIPAAIWSSACDLRTARTIYREKQRRWFISVLIQLFVVGVQLFMAYRFLTTTNW